LPNGKLENNKTLFKFFTRGGHAIAVNRQLGDDQIIALINLFQCNLKNNRKFQAGRVVAFYEIVYLEVLHA